MQIICLPDLDAVFANSNFYRLRPEPVFGILNPKQSERVGSGKGGLFFSQGRTLANKKMEKHAP
jgi:hypothetical protein